MSRIVVVLAALLSVVAAQSQPVCSINEVFNGKDCVCAAGYFTRDLKDSRCKDECDNVYKSWFTEGRCIDSSPSLEEGQKPKCSLRCGLRINIFSQIGILVITAAALSTLFFTIPMCIATCCSCIQANKNAKRVFNDTQATKSQEVSTLGYNPYAYWPYYGRS